MKYLFMLYTFIFNPFSYHNNVDHNTNDKDTYNDVAYVCNNGKTNVYHLSKDCIALNKCKYEIVTLKLTEVKNKGYRLCGFEK